MRIEKYNAARLGEFLDSEEYRTMPFIPVSPHRALSWLHNPRLDPGDVIMYLGYEQENMVAYRCIMPDRRDDIRFGWLSGIWVHPEYRRKGYASRLIKEARADWGQKLMVTDYAPEAKKLLDKSNQFELYSQSTGIRYYHRSTAANLLENRGKIYRRFRPLLKVADGMLNRVQDVRINFKKQDLKGIELQESQVMDHEAADFLEREGDTGFCIRSQEDFNWIVAYPWIKEGLFKDQRYFFSAYAPVFRNIILKIRSTGGEMTGLIWMVINGEKMTLPYAALSEGINHDISLILNHYINKYKISHLTAYHSGIIDLYKPSGILGSRKMTRNYLATGELLKKLPDQGKVNFQDGDGDVVFV